MFDRCESCDKFAELFELPGRRDRNCSHCTADIAAVLSLYSALKNAEREGHKTFVLEYKLAEVTRRLSTRMLGVRDPSKLAGPLLVPFADSLVV
jgi:hypothetical protein